MIIVIAKIRLLAQRQITKDLTSHLNNLNILTPVSEYWLKRWLQGGGNPIPPPLSYANASMTKTHALKQKKYDA